MDEPNTRRIVLLGKSGVGKSSLANTIFGEDKFQISHFDDSKRPCSQAENKLINGRSITLIDTPGFFDAECSGKEMNPELFRCITECAPGPHAFLIVLRVEKFTEHEQAVIERICQYFPADALKHAAVVFTHGDQLSDGMKIEQYADQSDGLSDLIKNSGGRCHVVDNKYWKNSQEDEYRSNQVQVEKLLHTIDKIVRENNEGYYTDEMLQGVERAIQKEEEHIRQSSGDMSPEEIRQQAKRKVVKKQEDKARRIRIIKLMGFAVFVGVVATFSAMWISSKCTKVITKAASEKEVIALPVAAVLGEQIAKTVEALTESPPAMEEVVEARETLLNTVCALCKRIYNLLNTQQ